MTPSELKYYVENAGHERYFFTRETMTFFGDTMRNYGVRDAGVIMSNMDQEHDCWELYRKRPVRFNNQSSAYFDKKTLKQIFPKK